MTEPKLLSGGNPQIPKGDGPLPVRAYLDAMPGWKRDVGEAVHAAVLRAAPDAAMAVKWNSPFYGAEPGRWFLSLHCFTRYVKLTWFDGEALDPVPPHASKHPRVRYAHVHEGEDAGGQVAAWTRQALLLPGERM